MTHHHHPRPPLVLSSLGQLITRCLHVTTQSPPCMHVHIGHPVSCLGEASPRFQHPCPPHPHPPKVNSHTILNHVMYMRLFLILLMLIGSHATTVPPHTGQQGSPLLLSSSPPKKKNSRGEGLGWPGGPLGNLKNQKVNLGRESGYTGWLRKPDGREEQMDSRDGQMDRTGGWTDWMGRWDEPDGQKPDGC